jgi:hypothetical protein
MMLAFIIGMRQSISGRLLYLGPGLPDSLFSYQRSQLGKILGGFRIENVDIFYGHSEYFTAVWYRLLTFGIA